MKTTGKVTGIVSNLVTVTVDGPVAENELCYITLGQTKLLAEVIKVKGKNVSVQVFESTRGLKNGDLDCSPVFMMVSRTTWRLWKTYF